MVRTLLIIAAASFVLMLAAFGGAAAIGGPQLMRNGWSIDMGDGSSTEWSGPTTERTLEWSGGDTLASDLPANVTYTQGDTPSVVISGPESIVQRVTLVDGRLSFPDDGEDRHFNIVSGPDRILEVTIPAPDVSHFVLEGYGDLHLNAIDQDSLEIRAEGAGDVEAHGRAGDLRLVLDGAGDADLTALSVDNADVRLSGAGSAQVNASQSANVEIDGVGNVDLTQRPAQLTQDVSGIGRVNIESE